MLLYTSSIHISASYQRKLSLKILFFWPLESIPASSSCAWYSGNQPVGKNTLELKLSRIYTLAGIEGQVTNHYSLRATSATQMYKNGVPEKIIQERTGHCSLESLHIYERTNCHQQEAVSNILSVPQAQNYTEQTYAASYPTSVCFHSNTTDSVQRLPISFGNLCGCTINIHPIACPPHQPSHPVKSLEMSWMISSVT